MDGQDRGPPKETAAGENTDDRKVSHSDCVEECTENTAKSSLLIARHESAITVLRGALASEQNELWRLAILVLKVRLTLRERTALAFTALRSLPPDDREATSLAAHDGSGAPVPPLFGFMAEATQWAQWATPAELEAYCLASYRVMAPARQRAFVEYISKGGRDGE